MSGMEFERKPSKPRPKAHVSDDVRSLGMPGFAWQNNGDLQVTVAVTLPKEPYGTNQQTGDNVNYQVWGTMQDASTPPNAVAWGTTSNRLEDHTASTATPTVARNAPTATYRGTAIKSYYAVQVTVRKAGSTTQDDQTIAVFQVPAQPT